MTKKPAKPNSRWFKGDVFAMSSTNFQLARDRYEKNVLKPTALRTKNVKGKVYSQFYHKPIKPGEIY